MLTSLYKVFFKISLSNWSPSMHNLYVRVNIAQLIYGIGLGKMIDRASLMYSSIEVAVEAKSSYQILSFPSLIHRIIACIHKPKCHEIGPCLKLKMIFYSSLKKATIYLHLQMMLFHLRILVRQNLTLGFPRFMMICSDM